MKDCRLPTRRRFLQSGAAGLAGATLSAACSRASPPGDTRQTRPALVFRTLGRTGLRLSIVSVGSTSALDLVRSALDLGIRYLHTSSSYSEQNHERMLGEVLRVRPRDSFVIASSPDLPYRVDRRTGNSMDVGTEIDPRLIEESVEGSLRRLRLDTLDIYYLPSVGSRPTALHEPYLRAYERLKKAGKVRFVGITTHSNEPEVIRAAIEARVWDVVLTAYNFRQSHREEVRAAIRQAAEAGLGVVAMKTQAGVYWDRTRLLKMNMKAALKWVLRDPNVHTTIPAFSNYDEMWEDLAVMGDLALTAPEEKDLRLGAALGLSGLYCQQCGRCLPQCPAGLDIPSLMRGLMYAAGYNEPARARHTLRRWTPADIACRDCDRCEVRCALEFDVRSRALHMARLLAVPEHRLG
jgi:hypothetical protein